MQHNKQGDGNENMFEQFVNGTILYNRKAKLENFVS